MSPNPPELTELLCRALHGDTASWEQVHQRHFTRISHFVRLRMDRRLLGRLDHEDILQEISLTVSTLLPDYLARSDTPFYFWLRGVAANKLNEIHRFHLRTQARDVRREDIQVGLNPDTTSTAISSLFVDSGTSPSDAAKREETRVILERTLQELDEIDREVLVLRHFEQLTPDETAELLGITKKAAGMRYVRAMQRLRSALNIAQD